MLEVSWRSLILTKKKKLIKSTDRSLSRKFKVSTLMSIESGNALLFAILTKVNIGLDFLSFVGFWHYSSNSQWKLSQ